MWHAPPVKTAAILLSACLAAPAAAADPLLLERPDLHAHFWASFALSLTLTEILEGPEPSWGPAIGTGWALLSATAAVGAVGVAKELLDAEASGEDLAADALGLATNALLQVTVVF